MMVIAYPLYLALRTQRAQRAPPNVIFHYPFSIHDKTIAIAYMWYNAQDIWMM